MIKKNNCDCYDKNSKFNAFANDLYSPKKVNLTKVCDLSLDCDIKDICCSLLLLNYTSFTKYKCNNYLVSKCGVDDSLFILDSNLLEIGKIILKVPSAKYIKKIVGVAYDVDLSIIYIAHTDKIFSVNNYGDFIKNEFNLNCNNQISSTNVCCGKNVSTKLFSNCNLCTIGISDCNLYVVYNKKGSSFIAKVTYNGNLVNEKYIDDDINPTNIFDTYCGLHILAIKNDQFKYLYTFDKNESYCKKNNCCNIVLNDECRIDIECEDFPCTLEGSLCEVVRSIALIEKAIAKLISCESEKIKSVIENCGNNNELIEVNNSVSKTIMNLTMFEQMLKEKLEIAISLHTC